MKFHHISPFIAGGLAAYMAIAALGASGGRWGYALGLLAGTLAIYFLGHISGVNATQQQEARNANRATGQEGGAA